MTSPRDDSDVTIDPFHLSARTVRLLDAGTEMELGDPNSRDLTYLERTLCQLSLPYRNPGPETSYWVRRNGRLQLTVHPGIGPDGRPLWAYGILPRLLLMWISDQVIKGTPAMQGRTVMFNETLRGFLEDLGIDYGGANARHVRTQVWALANTSLAISEFGEERARGSQMVVADEHDLLWSRHDPEHSTPLTGQSYITLSERFYEGIRSHPVPLETQVVAALRAKGSGGMTLDIYTWLKYRLFMAHLRKERMPLRMSWDSLSQQFGARYKLVRQFKANFVPQLDVVKTAWPMFRYDAGETLRIWPTDLYIRQLPPRSSDRLTSN